MTNTASKCQVLSSHIKRVGQKTVLHCDVFPLVGLGENGVEAISSYFASLSACASHSFSSVDFCDRLPTSDHLPSGEVRFRLNIPEPRQSLSGVINRSSGSFLGRIEGLPIQYSCPSLFATIENSLRRALSYFRTHPVSGDFADSLQQYFREGGVVEFSIRGNDLGRLILNEVRRV